MSNSLGSVVTAWSDRALELAWKQTPSHSLDPSRLTWPLDTEAIQGVTLRWPGEYDWPQRRVWGDQIIAALSRFVATDTVDIAQPYNGVIMFELVIQGRGFRISIDVSDYHEPNRDALRDSDLCFKMQYGVAGYGNEPRLLPGGFLNAHSVIYRYLPWLRKARDRFADQYDVLGRFELTMDKRRAPLEILGASRRFDFEGGRGLQRYSRYLREITRSSVCIDLPGTASITFRLFDYFAVGACVVAAPHTTTLPVQFEDGVHIAYCKADFSDLEEKCAYYLENENERRKLVQNSRDFFDAHMHRDQLASYYLFHCLDLLG